MKRLATYLRVSVFCGFAALAFGIATYLALAGGNRPHGSHAGSVTPDGHPLSNATVSWGSWMTSPPLDRFPNLSPRTANHHELAPQLAEIKAGGTVNFIIAGFHLVLVYDDGTQPADIDTSMTIPPTNQPVPPLINDPDRRIYRGLDPSTQSQDRVEVVHFANPGTYLVICGVLQGMFGFVKVVP